MEKQLLTNDFHHSTAWVVPKRATIIEHGYNQVLQIEITESQARRAKRILCGVRGCDCSDSTGARGPQRTAEGRPMTITIA